MGWPRAAEPCGGAPRWCGRVSSDGEALAVPLACASGEGGKAKLVVQVNWLGRDGRRAALIHGRTRPYQHGGGKSAKLELGSAFFMAGWGRAARELDGEAMDVLN